MHLTTKVHIEETSTKSKNKKQKRLYEYDHNYLNTCCRLFLLNRFFRHWIITNEVPRVPVNNRSINKTLQSLRNTCTRQITAYSKRKVTKLWEHFPRFSNSKRALCNRKVFFRPRLPIDAKEENVCNGLAWVLSLFPCLGSQIPEHSEILEDSRA
jgi:hypothetical protein